MSSTWTASMGALTLAAFGVLALAACGSANGDDGERYSARELRQGVPVAVEGNSAAVDSSVVFLPGDLPSYISLHPELADDGVAVLQPGEGGFDVVVVYRTGPYCGLLPAVSIDGDREQLTVAVESRTVGDCDAIQYDEAIGLDLSPGYERATVDASHDG